MSAPCSVYWSRAATRDMAAIGRHIAKDSPDNARKLVLRIADRVQLLGANPFMGHVGVKGRRTLVVHRHYLVFYRLLPDGVHILRVKHSARMQPL
ncbi:type II toxin-antitoxin system RelE/ParE family toxin [Duganella levis]|uniref:Type II toxin-antitoxin system RelE/ParE family toxin n=1 Tax=Duganella levis TaxID=2692169 RepID=A0ABW9W0J9_9BURK|nr:type II toxin-antitoxin system RelE/ParE family toxin [Duganella levis]